MTDSNAPEATGGLHILRKEQAVNYTLWMFNGIRHVLVPEKEFKEIITLSQKASKIKPIPLDDTNKKHKPWSEEDDKFLLENYTKMRVPACAKKLGRTRQALWARAKKLGVRRYVQGRIPSISQTIPTILSESLTVSDNGAGVQ